MSTEHAEPSKTKRLLLCTVVTFLLSSFSEGQFSAHKQDSTPVSGQSWLAHLARPFDETSMGKTGELGPPPQPGSDTPSEWAPTLAQYPNQAVSLYGSDLYRFNCRGCHGEKGLGAPPEIRPVINPMRATSVVLVMARMKSAGMEINYAQASEMANEARNAISKRLHNGGENMPAFSYLRDTEIQALSGYLDELAGVPGYQRAVVQESPPRIGELIVKSTCHICHDAIGANPTPQQMLDGAIPPLSTLTTRTTERDFIRKVTYGWPVKVSEPTMLQRGRMPVFYYLTSEEAADVYAYLLRFPPEKGQGSFATVLQTPDPYSLASGSYGFSTTERPVKEEVNDTTLVLISVLGIFVFLLIAAGGAITVIEFRRLSLKADAKAVEDSEPQPQYMHAFWDRIAGEDETTPLVHQHDN